MAEKPPGPAIVPILQYHDAKAAIDWLAAAFGFVPGMVVDDDTGGIAHAQIGHDTGVIMLSTCRDGDYGLRTPKESRVTTQSVYVVVSDPDALFERAVKAGAEVVRGLEDQDYGSRDFTVRDPEGHMWHFGTYRPA